MKYTTIHTRINFDQQELDPRLLAFKSFPLPFIDRAEKCHQWTSLEDVMGSKALFVLIHDTEANKLVLYINNLTLLACLLQLSVLLLTWYCISLV